MRVVGISVWILMARIPLSICCKGSSGSVGDEIGSSIGVGIGVGAGNRPELSALGALSRLIFIGGGMVPCTIRLVLPDLWCFPTPLEL